MQNIIVTPILFKYKKFSPDRDMLLYVLFANQVFDVSDYSSKPSYIWSNVKVPYSHIHHIILGIYPSEIPMVKNIFYEIKI